MNEYNEFEVEEKRKPFIKVLKWVLCVILAIAVVVLLFWLFRGCSKQTSPIADETFYNNLERMKDAASSYYTLERLPGEEGDTTKLTLEEMINQKLVLTLSDKNGKKCDVKKSYVEVTKLATEYQMKVYLSCSGEEDYIIVYMGCYDYCKNFICEKQEEVIKTDKLSCSLNVVSGTLSSDKKNYISNVIVKFGSKVPGKGATITDSGIGMSQNYNNTSYTVTKDGKTIVYGYVKDSNGDTASCNITINKTTPSVKKYEYLYKKTVAAEYSDWTDWSANKEYTEKDNIVWGKQELVWNEKNGGAVTPIITYKEDPTQPIWQNKYTKILGYYKQYLCDGYTYFRDSYTNVTYQTGSYVLVDTVRGADTVPSDTYNTKYDEINMSYDICLNNCSVSPKFDYNVYKRTTTAQSETTTKEELSAVCNVKEYQVPIYGLELKLQGYVTDKITTNKLVYYYHTRTRELIKKAYTSEIWSSSSNDTSLINQGYTYTGTRREA